MKKVKFLLLAVAAALLTACGTTNTVPLTGRKQNLLVSDQQILSLSTQQYSQYMATAKRSTDAAKTAMVKRCGERISNAVVSYLKANGLAADVAAYKWEINLVQDKSANAFCMPGGKIVVYEGLLPFTQTEDALAIVMGHEVAHAVAKHSAEKLSKQMKAQYGAQALGVLLGSQSAALQQLGQTAFGFGANSVLRGFSRSNESEADYMGLIFAAMAGYDPSAAVTFWQRMAAGSQSSIPEFFSDHPSDEKRIANIQKWLPEAKKYYKPQQSTSVPLPGRTK
ncbi:MAG: M48 family metallopeptidase [Alloprevotella sp.]|nr:M48 family metallopeptidase [Alloprevotella sp.]